MKSTLESNFLNISLKFGLIFCFHVFLIGFRRDACMTIVLLVTMQCEILGANVNISC